jgi:hypothetical protein
MFQIAPRKRVTWLALLLVASYGMFAFFIRDSLAEPVDRLKV